MLCPKNLHLKEDQENHTNVPVPDTSHTHMLPEDLVDLVNIIIEKDMIILKNYYCFKCF